MFLRMVLDGLAALRFFAMGNFKDFVAIIKAHFHFYGSLNKTLKKRKQVQAKVKNHNISGIYRKSIVRKYFIERKTVFSELNAKDFS